MITSKPTTTDPKRKGGYSKSWRNEPYRSSYFRQLQIKSLRCQRVLFGHKIPQSECGKGEDFKFPWTLRSPQKFACFKGWLCKGEPPELNDIEI